MRGRMMLACACLVAALIGLTIGCGSKPAGSDKPKIAFVTNCIADFWVIGEKGANDAAKEFNVDVEVKMPNKQDAAEQKAILQALLSRGFKGVAISPTKPDDQKDILDEVAANAILITHDSDAPNSKRVVYIGMENYTAGRECGKLVKEALPDGGKIMFFVGSIEQLNGKERRQGLIDEILGRSPDSKRFDPPGKPLTEGKYTIIDTRTDSGNPSDAKSQAEDAIAKYPDLNCMVGLFGYNTPKCLEAVRVANKLGTIKIVGFDEEADTLQGVADGHVLGTVVQDPYRYGYESVRILAALIKGDKSVLPKSGTLFEIPVRTIRKDNVEEFWNKLEKLTGKSRPKK